MRGLWIFLGLGALAGGSALYYFQVYRPNLDDAYNMIAAFDRAGADTFEGLGLNQRLEIATQITRKLTKKQVKQIIQVMQVPENAWSPQQTSLFVTTMQKLTGGPVLSS